MHAWDEDSVAALSHRLAPLEGANDDQDDEDDQQDSGAARRVIAPAGAVGPSRQGADQEEDQKNEKQGAQHEFDLFGT